MFVINAIYEVIVVIRVHHKTVITRDKYFLELFKMNISDNSFR